MRRYPNTDSQRTTAMPRKPRSRACTRWSYGFSARLSPSAVGASPRRWPMAAAIGSRPVMLGGAGAEYRERLAARADAAAALARAERRLGTWRLVLFGLAAVAAWLAFGLGRL